MEHGGGVRWSPQVLDIFGPEDLNGSSGTLESLESPQPEGGKGGKYKVHLSHLSHDGVISVKRKNFIILCKVQLFGLRNDLHNGKVGSIVGVRNGGILISTYLNTLLAPFLVLAHVLVTYWFMFFFPNLESERGFSIHASAAPKGVTDCNSDCRI